MFSLDLHHFNILVMLILAFFSYKNYRGDALALDYDYESEEDMNEIRNEDADETVEKKEKNVEVGSEMVPQSIEVAQISAECTSNPTPIDKEARHEQLQTHPGIQAETVSPNIELISAATQKIVQSTISTSSLPIQKQSDEESTLLNRNIQLMIRNQCLCDEEEEEGIFSSDTSSINSSSCSSCPSAEDLNTVDKKEKRKLIQKAKRKMKKHFKKKQQMKKHLKNKQFQQSQPLLPLVQ